MNQKYWRSRIGELWKKGYPSKGVIHVGSNDGYEVQWYKALGIKNIICFEPLPSAVKNFKKNNPETTIYQYALGNRNFYKKLNIAIEEGYGSSLLESKREKWVGSVKVKVVRFDSLKNIDHSLYDALVVDVQGYEMQVLEGFGKHLKNFTRLNIEVSNKPMYEGSASGQEILKFLEKKGFRALNEITEHDDLLLVKRNEN